jgi:PAS domain S-box-containing protein
MLCIASTDGYFKRINAAFIHELGWPEEELLRRPFISLVHPDDVEATLAEIGKLAEGMPTIAFENRFLCMDGEYKLLRWNSFPDEDTGRLYAIARVRPMKTPESS